MIRLIKWKPKQFEISGLVPSTLYFGIGNIFFDFSIFSGGFSLVFAYKNMYEIQVFKSKKRVDLQKFGFNDVKYMEFFK